MVDWLRWPSHVPRVPRGRSTGLLIKHGLPADSRLKAEPFGIHPVAGRTSVFFRICRSCEGPLASLADHSAAI